MKRKTFLIPMAVVAISLVACGGGKTPEPDPDPTGSFEVTWDLGDGVIEKETYKKGDMPSYKKIIDYKESRDPDYGYLFKSWDKQLVPVTENVTYHAVYDSDASCIVSTAVLMTLKKQNIDHCEFHYTGHLKEVDWGDGTPRNQENTHTYTYAAGEDNKTFLVKIFGNITSLSFSNKEGVYGKSNLAIRSITLASTITDVPDYAFNGCTYADSIFLDKNIKHVGVNATKNLYNNCLIYAQTGISYAGWDEGWNPNSYRVVSNIKRLGLVQDEIHTSNYFGYIIQEAASGKDYLAISSYFTNDKAFGGDITIPDELDDTPVEAVVYSPFLIYYNIKKFNVTDNLIYLGIESFKEGKMAEFILPQNTVEIADRAFEHCINLTKFDTTDNNSLTTIGDHAFHYSYQLGTFNIPSTVNYIGPHAFDFCRPLKPTGLENCKITRIEDGTFLSCDSMEEIAFPATLKSIGDGAFAGCRSLATIDASIFDADNIPTCESTSFENVAGNVTVYVNNDEFSDAETAKAAFAAKGWPAGFTYTPQA